MIRFINEIPLAGQRVLVRLDLNTPLKGTSPERVADASRIEASLPTLRYILDEGAEKVIIISHLGRPKGERNERYSLAPVGEYLANALGEEVVLSESCTDRGLPRLLSLPQTKVVLLENVRFHREEVDNDVDFAKKLASLGDIYVNDAFGVCHRQHASVAAIIDFFKGKAMGGFLLKREIECLGKLALKSSYPLVTLMGGSKVADKIEIIESLLTRSQTLLVGGAMAYPFLVAEGFSVGKSLCSPEDVELAKKMKFHPGRKKMVLPVDHIVAPSPEHEPHPYGEADIPDGVMGLDIGEGTRRLFARHLKGAHSIFWNGPMGFLRRMLLRRGTMVLAKSIARRPASVFKVVGGGDSLSAIKKEWGRGSVFSHFHGWGGIAGIFTSGGRSPCWSY